MTHAYVPVVIPSANVDDRATPTCGQQGYPRASRDSLRLVRPHPVVRGSIAVSVDEEPEPPVLVADFEENVTAKRFGLVRGCRPPGGVHGAQASSCQLHSAM